jgi:hypothetical protein
MTGNKEQNGDRVLRTGDRVEGRDFFPIEVLTCRQVNAPDVLPGILADGRWEPPH